MRFDVVALGELLIDFTPYGTSEKNSPVYELNPGGAPPNALSAVVRQGGTAAFIGKVGKDYFGDYLVNTLRNLAINTEGLLQDERYATTLAIVSLDETGDRSFGFYRNQGADTMLAIEEVNTALIAQGALFHFGSLTLTSEPARSATFHALEQAKSSGCYISYDPNLRKPLWENEALARKHIMTGLPYADILKIGKDEFAFLFDTEDYQTYGQKVMDEYDIRYLFVTDGPHGAYYRHQGYSGLLPTYDVSVVDTTGAGDAFTGAVIRQLAQLSPKEFSSLPEERLREMVDIANASGALTTTKSGGVLSIPTLEEIQQCQAEIPYLK